MFKQNMIDWNKGKWIFRDIYNLGFPYYHIHPYKQKAVKYLVDNILNWVTQVIVFGSSISPCHFYEKDLDICLVGDRKNQDSYSKLKLSGHIYDFLWCPSFNDLLMKSENFDTVYMYIVKEGVLVYEQENFVGSC